MARRIRLALAFAAAVALLIVPSAAAGTLDQSQPGIRTNAASFVSDLHPRAQTFTSGLTGALDQVDVAIGRNGSSVTVPLLVEIRSVSGGQPTGPTLASASVPATSVPDGFFASAFLSIPFSSPAPVTAGVQYAIVASSGHCGFINCYGWALGPVGDPYAAGSGRKSLDSGATWAPLNDFGSTDFPFQTYVLQGPTSKQQCKKGGWKKFKNPSFKNQGQCVKWFNHHGGKAKGNGSKANGKKDTGGPGNSGKDKKKGGKKK
jgi:hypothetical protein